MTIYNAGGEMGALIPSDSSVKEITTTSVRWFDSAFARAAISIPFSTNYAEMSAYTGLTEFWIHFDIRTLGRGSSVSGRRLTLFDSSDVARAQLHYASHTLSIQCDTGGGMTTVGSPIAIDLNDALQTMDLRVVCDSATGSAELYIAGTERINSGSIDLSAITELEYARFYGDELSGLADTTYISQCLIADESTIGMRVMTGYPSANGANTAWTGDYTSVDEAVTSDADFIFSATNGQRETYPITLVGSLTGYTPRALIVAARAKKGSSGPENLQLTAVSGATTSDTSSIALGLGYGAHVGVWEDDPNTTLDWTSANISAVQIGVEANT